MQNFISQEDVHSYFSALKQEDLIPARQENHLLLPEQMGIYFWFLREEGFERLSRKVPVIFRPPEKTFKIGDAYLVFYGHVGMGTDVKSIQLMDNLRLYFQCAIPHKQLEYSLDGYSLLSCFRKTIGSLLCDDLLTEQETVKSFFHDYFMTYYLGYEATTHEVGVAASKALKVDYCLLKRTLFALSHNFIAGANHTIKEDFVFDDYAPEIRYIMEQRRWRTEQITLENIRNTFQLGPEAGQELITASRFF